MTTLPLTAIVITDRHRKDMGDIGSLAASITEVGLLHPPVVDVHHRLVAGQRRVAAVRQLGWTEVTVTVAASIGDRIKALVAEQDENECRLEMAPSEKVTLGMDLEGHYKAEAKERQRVAGQEHGRGIASAQVSGSYSESPGGGESRAAVANAVGLSRAGYIRAKSVVVATSDPDPEISAVAITAKNDMDSTGAIFPAAQKVLAAKAAKAPAASEKPSRTITDADRQQIRDMAARGSSTRQIAAQLGRHEASIRNQCKTHGIDVPADAVIGKTHRHDSNRVAREIVSAVDGAAFGVDLIDLDALDKSQIAGWVASLTASIRSLNQILKAMKELTQ